MFEATFSSLFHSVVKQNPEALCVQDSAGNRATRAEHFGRVRRLVGGFHTRLGLDKSSKFAVLARGEAGEITARTASLMTGYLNMPEATEAVCRDGRYHTGDIGYAHCRELLASYKCPKVVHIQAEALPVSGTNKVLKSVLREQYGH